MPAYQTKKSVMAVVAEVTEGTPVAPSAGTQFVPIEDGFSLTLKQDSLENAELTGSIGKAKPITGFETPDASISLYLKHSGVEGQAPNYSPLLEAAFGAKAVNASEYVTIAASTVATIKSTSASVNFERGEGLLIKDGVNGYSIRPVLSTSGNDITLGFQLPTGTAPAAGVSLGKAVLYKPAETHPSLTVWDYRANAAAVQMAAGMRVTEYGLEANAGELINQSFSLEGIKNYFNPIEIGATDTKLDFVETGPTTRVATIAAKMYKDPHELAAAIETAMDAVATDDITVSYSNSTGKFTISTSGALLSLLWNTGVNTANSIGDKIGYSLASDDTGFLTYDSDTAQSLAAPFTVAFDASNPLVAKNNECFLGDSTDANPACFSVASLSLTLADSKADVKDVCAESGKSASVVVGREVTVEFTANIQQYDADKFKRFRTNQQTSLLYNFGTKSGGNWEAGKVGCLYIPTATISELSLDDVDGLVVMKGVLSAYVASGAGEVYLNFL